MSDDAFIGPDGEPRCAWCGGAPEFLPYHDHEWGMPVGDDRTLFEKMVLEGFQSGLSWRTILNKRPRFRAAFANFEIDRVARFDDADRARLLADAGIVRHRGKIDAAIHNAARAREVRDAFGSFAAYLWGFEPDPAARPRVVTESFLRETPTSPASTALSKDLKRRGFAFVGPTTMYALMQAMGLVNDHPETCAIRARVEAARESFVRPTRG